MQLSAEQQNQLYQLISAEQSQVESLLDIVRREQLALKGHNAEQILTISSEKQEAISRLQACMKARDAWLAGHDLATGTQGASSLMDHNADTAVSQLWQKLGKLAKSLHEQNEINGGIVTLNQRHNKQALDILCGRSGRSHTYGAKGQQNQEQSGQSLAKA